MYIHACINIYSYIYTFIDTYMCVISVYVTTCAHISYTWLPTYMYMYMHIYTIYTYHSHKDFVSAE